MFLQKAWRLGAFGLYGFTQFTKSGFQEHSKRFKEEDMQISTEGKNCLVTGANSGIGFAAAEGLASKGATSAGVFALIRLSLPLPRSESNDDVTFQYQSLVRGLEFRIRIDPFLVAMFLQKAWRVGAFGLYGFTQFTKSGFQEHSKRFKEEDMQISIEGKNCLVTGANSGIGFAAAEGLASKGATVYLLCRNKDRGEEALSKIKSSTGNQNLHLEICDLSSISDVKSFASRFSSSDKPLHVLVNNAGLLEHPRTTTSEGLELNFAVNVAGTYTLTESLLPLLEKASPDARVITVSSGGMYTSPVSNDLQWSENANFDGTMQYARNKRIQVALTEKWSEMYSSSKGIAFYSMHPGWSDTPGVAKNLPGLSQKMEGKLRSSEEGADTVLWLALQPKENLVSGAFYFDREEARKHLPLAGTASSHDKIDSIIKDVRSLCGLPC